jgi:CheY-like chemotaxis protein/nitrogen-specific signal transduction histidine kinase
MTGILRDTTARKQVEAERLLIYQELKNNNSELESARFMADKANQAKSDFLSSMSHELRTPLNAILGFAQLLEVGTPPPSNVQLLRITQIIKAGWYLLDLINEILDLAIIESGRLLLSREPVQLYEVMQECQTMIEPQALLRGIKIDFQTFDVNWFANADRTRVKQIFINLLSNSIKYNRESGTVEVTCAITDSNKFRVSIKDSGNGISPENLKLLFQPFNRLGQEAGSEEGTGIGLVVTKQLTELMGGIIGVESTVGVGSEFWVEFVRDETVNYISDKSRIKNHESDLHSNTNKRTLLYIEDNPANLLLVEQIAADCAYLKIISACDALSGINLAVTHQPHIILMDINLPGISGFDALKILQNDPAIAHIPVLAISANAMPRDIKKGLEAGFFCYLTKPIKVKELMDAIDRASEASYNRLKLENAKVS